MFSFDAFWIGQENICRYNFQVTATMEENIDKNWTQKKINMFEPYISNFQGTMRNKAGFYFVYMNAFQTAVLRIDQNSWVKIHEKTHFLI